MAAYYKKRRRNQGPNKNEAKVARAQRAESSARMAGVMGARFPSIKRLTLHLIFLDRQRVLEEKDLSISPQEAATFLFPCPGRCGRGQFDIAVKIAEAVTGRLPLFEFSLPCAEPYYSAKAEPCGCELKGRMQIDFFPAPADTAKAESA